MATEMYMYIVTCRCILYTQCHVHVHVHVPMAVHLADYGHEKKKRPCCFLEPTYVYSNRNLSTCTLYNIPYSRKYILTGIKFGS